MGKREIWIGKKIMYRNLSTFYLEKTREEKMETLIIHGEELASVSNKPFFHEKYRWYTKLWLYKTDAEKYVVVCENSIDRGEYPDYDDEIERWYKIFDNEKDMIYALSSFPVVQNLGRELLKKAGFKPLEQRSEVE